MMLTPAQIASVAKAAGWTGQDLITAVAVAMAESGDSRGANPGAHNPNPPDNSYGLWQVNMLGAMGPERRRAFGLTTNEQLFDPATNARVAHGIWKGQGWQRGWTTYSSGRYRQYLDEAAAGVGKPAPVPPGSPGSPASPRGSNTQVGLVESLAGVNQSIKSIADTIISGGKVADMLLKLFLPSNMMRLFLGIIGTLFLFAGIFVLGREVRN